MLGDNLGVQTGLCAFYKKVSLLFLALISNFDRDFLDSFDALVGGFSVSLDDDLRSHAFFDESLGLLQELSGGEDNGGGSISDLVVLGSCDINEGLSGWMHDVEETNQSGTIVGDSHTSAIMDKFIHSSWAQGGLHNLNDSLASVDV